MSQPIIDTPENWGKASKGYASEVAPRMMDLYAAEFIDRLQADQNSKIIEVAAGSGAMTVPMSKRVGSILATDFSPQMIEVLQSRISQEGIQNVELSVMDGQNLDVADESYDGIICSFGLMFFPDRVKGFSEFHRVLKPGGKAVVSGWSTPDRFEAFAIFLAAMNQAFPDLPKPDETPPVFRLADLEQFKSEMESAGFNKVSTEYVTRQLTLENKEEIWTMLTAGAPPIQMLFDKVGEDGKQRLQEALYEIVDRRFGSGPISFQNSATLGVGIKV